MGAERLRITHDNDSMTATDHTPQQLAVLRWAREKSRCEADFAYLASHYLRIKSKETIGFPTLKFNPVQQRIHAVAEDQIKRRGYIRLVLGKPRQIGSSSYWQAKTIHQTAFQPNRNAILVAHDEPSAIEIFSITKGYYDALPLELRPRTRYDAKQRMIFEGRNSKIIALHAANANVGAGQMFHVAHLTEAARFPDPEKLQGALFPALSAAKGQDYSTVVIESTSVFGGDWFKDLGDQAMAGDNEFEFLFIAAHEHHAYHLPVPRDFALTYDERELKQKYGATDSHFVWRRQEAAKYRSNPALMLSEYPWDWPGSWSLPRGALRVFNDDILSRLARAVRPPDHRAIPSSVGLEKTLGGVVEVWQPPKEGVYYDMGVDIAEGRTERADWTVACVVRRDTLEQVAQMRVHLNPASVEFIDLIYWLGHAYNTAQICPDITGGWGNALLTELQMRSYPSLWRWRRRDDMKQRVSLRVGFLYTRRDKITLVNNAVSLAVRGDVVLHSDVLADELRTYLNIGLDEWAAAPGCFDDATNAWFLALLAARDERVDAMPIPADDPPTAALTTPWAVHDVDADLDPAADVGLLNQTPWR